MSHQDAERIAELFEQTARVIFAAKSSHAAKPPRMKALAFELTLAQGRCLWAISQRENCTLREVSRHLSVRPSTTSQLVERLVQAGLVQRESDPDDRRAVRLRLSKKGRGVFDRHRAHRRTHLSQFLDRLTPAQRKAMLGALEALNDVVQQVGRESKDESGAAGC